MLLAGGWLVLPGRSGPSVPTAPVARRDLLVPIMSDGNLEPPPGGELRAPENATVGAIFATEGQRVAPSTPLVRLDDPELSQSSLAARSTAITLTEERARAAAAADSARRESEHRRGVFEGDERLLAQSAIPKSVRDADELAWRQSQDRAQEAEARLDSLDGRGSEGEGGTGTGSRLRISADSARELARRVASLTLKSATAGIVYGLPRKVGEMVTAGQLVASVADPEHLRVRTRVDQPDLPRIAVGQRMEVTFDGLPDRRWRGKVLAVPSGIVEAAGRQVGEVIGEISDPDRALPPNASVNVMIVAGEKHDALAIPRAALLRDGDVRYVYVLENGRARRRVLTVGLVGLSDVEVKSGLSEHDVVVIPGTTSTPLADGVRITAARKT